MGAIILNGKEISQEIRKDLKAKVDELKQNGLHPGLAVVLVGNDPASRIYVNNKKKACEEIGIRSFEYILPEKTTEEELIQLVETLNKDNSVHGILVQLPLPKHIDAENVLLRISPDKDVDSFHPFNMGRVMIGDYYFLPCTPAGIMELLIRSGINLVGKECVVVGRSNIVGKPIAMLLLHSNATVTICHSKTRNLKEICRRADVLVVAVGKPKFINADYVKDGAVVIDVGINRLEDGKICGDVDFDSVSEKASYITPVPGGVGPMTITMLLKNTIMSAELSRQ
ncbi:bifunctional 5,10-methylenetetrahydrofolate dehydrogenase (NADP+)/methenyltetrahydrofolate cyclohydrolase FolD [Thermoclostridium stercorarium subsp. stercorarium DSM 8532]|jgi:methylenetetrahydrofolate dehydrogenase (NADP+)/methenyltetrahydrofolate cyclohydrolase|uniref:Bifunctional protein FolD n=3 Tax=Thermoclostridium stercorarium TaxID=1510 RepID=L7VP50_THES1|nr:bifunctional methylenetetrahydrofolate dehydrogenase/methenyltetrahydrofolate cyclohydrolase FolD [Thermoclostridium stercorarium]AGC68454.1 bifunctional 5,10-methylenetetrahydrofolate dehydrogenase (NADP+)/methenyltetrahydrofolate cyclohydrolase FolD [Thermoclostridium stercorarium subsp. stercorarium DSM 8532]AGI39473.1 methenyltetrahydrofolate cyclohydrolase [Thermoclostridium stercorarium subsp. stercorarium DSM 8532]ANW98820.1 bifunctional 5,10-methylene-tetrahydrofolate dehydrogenase/5,